VRTNAVAREAGVSSALIFYYFGTRQELLRKAFDYADARTETPGLRCDDAESPAIETIERTLLGQVDNAKVVRENWVLWSEMSAAALFDPGLRDAVNVAAERWVRCVRELILTGGLSSERTRELVRGAIELELGVVLRGSKRTGTPR
jgi:AcrR family transcriptional regulator